MAFREKKKNFFSQVPRRNPLFLNSRALYSRVFPIIYSDFKNCKSQNARARCWLSWRVNFELRLAGKTCCCHACSVVVCANDGKWERVKAKTRQSKTKKSWIWKHVIWKGNGVNETKWSKNQEKARQEECLSHGRFVMADIKPVILSLLMIWHGTILFQSYCQFSLGTLFSVWAFFLSIVCFIFQFWSLHFEVWVLISECFQVVSNVLHPLSVLRA